MFDTDYFCYGAHLETTLKGKPGQIVAQRNHAICIATADAAIWLTHLKAVNEDSIKLPVMIAMKGSTKEIPVSEINPFENISDATWQDIRFKQENDIGYLHFHFYNGAMSAEQCNRLRVAFWRRRREPK